MNRYSQITLVFSSCMVISLIIYELFIFFQVNFSQDKINSNNTQVNSSSFSSSQKIEKSNKDELGNTKIKKSTIEEDPTHKSYSSKLGTNRSHLNRKSSSNNESKDHILTTNNNISYTEQTISDEHNNKVKKIKSFQEEFSQRKHEKTKINIDNSKENEKPEDHKEKSTPPQKVLKNKYEKTKEETKHKQKVEVKNINDTKEQISNPIKLKQNEKNTKIKYLIITSSKSILRSSPSKIAEKVDNLIENSHCEVIKKIGPETLHLQDEIIPIRDFWYNVNCNSKNGWIFGYYTSLRDSKD